MVLKRSMGRIGGLGETRTEKWTWNCLSGPMGGVGGLGETLGLGRVYHGLWTV